MMQAKSHADRLAMKDGADRSSFAPVSLNPSMVHAGAPQPRRRRRGGGVEHGPVRASGGGENEGGKSGGMQWQCQVSRPGRVVPHQATMSVSEGGVLLQWNHMEALIGKDSLAEAFLTGKDYIPAVNILAVTCERHGGEEVGKAGTQGGGRQARNKEEEEEEEEEEEVDALCLHVLTTPSPITSPEAQSEYNIYRLSGFEGGGSRRGYMEGEAGKRDFLSPMSCCRVAIDRLAKSWPSLAGRRGGRRGEGGGWGGADKEEVDTHSDKQDSKEGQPFRLYFVVNPVSGHRQGEVYWKKVEPLLQVAGVCYDVTLTQHSGHAASLFADKHMQQQQQRRNQLRDKTEGRQSIDLDRYDGIICIGGDGTVSEVVNALMQRSDVDRQMHRLVLATLPAGSECAVLSPPPPRPPPRTLLFPPCRCFFAPSLLSTHKHNCAPICLILHSLLKGGAECPSNIQTVSQDGGVCESVGGGVEHPQRTQRARRRPAPYHTERHLSGPCNHAPCSPPALLLRQAHALLLNSLHNAIIHARRHACKSTRPPCVSPAVPLPLTPRTAGRQVSTRCAVWGGASQASLLRTLSRCAPCMALLDTSSLASRISSGRHAVPPRDAQLGHA
jgi:hypothetical protein